MPRGTPHGERERAAEQREDNPVLTHLGGGELERAWQEVELVLAERPEDRASAVRQLVSRDVRRAA